MEDKDIKKALDCINTNELSKSRMLNNINLKMKNQDNGYQLSYKKYKRTGLFMNYKKVGSIVAASVILVGGFALYNIKDNTNNIQTPPSSSPIEGEVYIPEVEFNNFVINDLKGNISKIQIKNHTNDYVFKTIENKDLIDNTVSLLETTKKKEMTDEVFESIAKSQTEGESVVLSFIKNDGTTTSMRINLDLDIACINSEYHDVSPKLINLIKNELKDLKDFKELNIPVAD